MKYKPRRTKVYKVDETKEELRGRCRRYFSRIAALESHINHHLLGIRQGLRAFEKSKEYSLSKHGKIFLPNENENVKETVYLWCVVEVLQFITHQKPVVGGENAEQLFYFPGDGETPAKLYETKKDAKKEEVDVSEVYRVKYFNAVNAFLTKEAAEKHLKEFRDKYTNAKVVSMFPLENKEMKEIRKHFYFLGENVPGAKSIWENQEDINDLKSTISKQITEVTTKDEEIKRHIKENEKLKKEIDNLKTTILIKKGKN